MLPEKSMKTTTAVACRTAAGTDGVQPVVERWSGVVRARSQSIIPRRYSTTILLLVLAVHRDLWPQLQCREFGVLAEGERWQESTEANVGLPVHGDPLAGQRPDLVDLALGRSDLPVDGVAEPEELLADGVPLPVQRFERPVELVELLVRIMGEVRGGHRAEEDQAVEREQGPGHRRLVGSRRGSLGERRGDVNVPEQARSEVRSVGRARGAE